jgi:hypothetical protein
MEPALQCYESVLDEVLGQPAITCEQHSQPQQPWPLLAVKLSHIPHASNTRP